MIVAYLIEVFSFAFFNGEIIFLKEVEFASINTFQRREKDFIILFSCDQMSINSLNSSMILRLVWVGWALWHIKHCRLFNAKSCLCIY